LKSQSREPSSFSYEGGELSVSGPALVSLMRGVLAKGASFRFQAKGFSMSPFIKDGDLVTIAPLSENGPGLGDVVAFTHPKHGKLVVHRVIGRRRDTYVIGGDNTPDLDGDVPAKNVLGYVTHLQRDGKKICLGLGPERYPIALLAHRRLLIPFLLLLRRFIQPFRERMTP